MMHYERSKGRFLMPLLRDGLEVVPARAEVIPSLCSSLCIPRSCSRTGGGNPVLAESMTIMGVKKMFYLPDN